MNAIRLAFLLLPVWIFPWQISQSSKMTVERYSNCSGLSNTACCEQMLRLAAFKASRAELPKRAIQAVRLGCRNKQQLASRAACRGIAFSRLLSAGEVKTICNKGAVRRKCRKNAICKQCTSDLAKLGYSNSHWACLAVTHRKKGKSDDSRVVKLPGDENTNPDATRHVIKRREVIR